MAGKSYSEWEGFGMRKWNLQRSVKGMPEEQAKERLRDKALKQELAFWRKELLMKYREKEKVGEL